MDSLFGRKHTFRQTQCSQEAWYLRKNCSHEIWYLWSWISRLGKIAFSGLKNEEYPHSLWSTLKRWFTIRQQSNFQTAEIQKIYSCAKFAHTKLETWISRLGKIAFSGLKRVETFYTLRGTLKLWFHESAEIAFSGCQNAEVWYMRKICTHEDWCRWNVHFSTAHKRIFSQRIFLTLCEDAKMRKICSHVAR